MKPKNAEQLGMGLGSADSGQAGEYHISPLGTGLFPPRVKSFVLWDFFSFYS